MWFFTYALTRGCDSSYGSQSRRYLPDFIVLVEDGHDEEDLLHLVVEIKGYRKEDAKAKKEVMEAYWVPGVKHLGQYGRWAFVELTEVYQIEEDFTAKVESSFDEMVSRFAAKQTDRDETSGVISGRSNSRADASGSSPPEA